MKTPSGRTDLLINAGIALAATILVAALLYRFAGNDKPGISEKTENNAVTLPLLNIDWKKNGQTVLLVITDDCSYCYDSAGFYRSLSNELRKTGNAKLIVIFPDRSSAGENYLKEVGLSGNEFRHEALKKIGVTSTPTLLLVGNAGIVTNVWAGKLGADDERDVFDRLQLDRASLTEVADSPHAEPAAPIHLIQSVALKQAIDQGSKLIVLDIRTREEFARGHIPTSRNIPADELEVRSINELLRSDPIVLYCDRPGEELSRFANLIMREQKFERVSVLSGGLADWRNAGWQIIAR